MTKWEVWGDEAKLKRKKASGSEHPTSNGMEEESLQTIIHLL
jgi:hypothetical protein